MSGKVLIAAPVHEVLLKGLEAAGYTCVLSERINQETAYALIGDCVGIITSTRLQLDKGLLDAAPLLKWVGRMGSGMEVIDVSYAKERGIACYSSPEGNRNAVAEHVMGMLLCLNNNILKSYEEVKAGKWLRDENRGEELEGKTIGIIGMGHTGSTLAKKLTGFDVKVLGYDKYDKGNFREGIIDCPDLTQIYEEADIISFHVPLHDDSKHYLNKDFVDKMRKPFILVNASRGQVVDSRALVEGLENGKIKGACIDVWEEEPLDKMSKEMRTLLDKVLGLSNVIVTPHIAGYSNEALYKMSNVLLTKIVISR